LRTHLPPGRRSRRSRRSHGRILRGRG
jgi:hypothetical protein